MNAVQLIHSPFYVFCVCRHICFFDIISCSINYYAFRVRPTGTFCAMATHMDSHTVKMKCFNAAISEVMSTLLFKYYITGLSTELQCWGDDLHSYKPFELRIPTISSSCTWICLWTSAIWNSTSPAKMRREREIERTHMKSTSQLKRAHE